MGGPITFQRPDGGDAAGWLAEAKAGAPGVVVIQEWWGVQEQIQRVCERLATAGFDALAPDLYGGKVVPYHDAQGAAALSRSLDLVAGTDTIVRGAVRELRLRGGKVAVIGFCMGGVVAAIASARVPEVTAAVTFYGLPPPQATRPADVRVPLQGHFAEEDGFCTPEKVDAFEKALAAAGKPHEFHRYPGTRHAFMNEDRPEVYAPEAAPLAWERTLTFLAARLV